MAPLPSTRVIPAAWAVHHRTAALGTMTATCTVETGGEGTWAPDTGGVPGTPTTLYAGPCVVTDMTRTTRVRDVAGQALAEHPYTVGIAPTAPAIPEGARVKINTCADDPLLVGLVLRVVDVSHESLMLERVLTCDLDLHNQPGG